MKTTQKQTHPISRSLLNPENQDIQYNEYPMMEHSIKQHFLRNGLIGGFVLLIVLVLIFGKIYLDLTTTPHSISKIILFLLMILFCLLCCIFLTRFLIQRAANQQNWAHLAHFHRLDELGIYRVAQSRFYAPKKTYAHIVLLLHGFTTSSHEMRYLAEHLEKNQIPYFAPTLTGFGLTDFHLLKTVEHKDWFRSVLFYYDCLSTLSDHITIIGHSMGGALAAYVAQSREVHRLILCAPALYLFASDKILINALLTPILSHLFETLIPYLPKTIRKTSNPLLLDKARFQYLSVPTHAAKEVLKAREKINLSQVRTKELYLLYGSNDAVVNNKEVINTLKIMNIPHAVECLQDTAHNLFEEHTKKKACEIILKWLA